MTKIKFGNQHDDSSAQHSIVSDGGSSEIEFGDQYDRSRLSTRILDLKDPADLAVAAKELASLSQEIQDTPEAQAHPEDVKALDAAAKHAAAGDGEAVRSSLKSVGKWVLATATAIGTPVAVELLKSVAGL